MISRIKGTLIIRDIAEIVVDVHGVGFALSVPVSTFEKLPPTGQSVELLTHLHVRDDAFVLYGFASEQERSLFRMLIGVSGIGVRLALSVLSCMSVSEFCRNIRAGDVRALSRINGVGKRSAERMVVELRERVEDIDPSAAFAQPGLDAVASREAQDAVIALERLGFKSDVARRAVRKAAEELEPDRQTADRLLKSALKILNS